MRALPLVRRVLQVIPLLPFFVALLLPGCTGGESTGSDATASTRRAEPVLETSSAPSAATPSTPGEQPGDSSSGPGAEAELEPPLRGLSDGEASVQDLAQTVLHAIREKDPGLLASLLVTEREYKELLFPQFPQAGGPIPVRVHWELLSKRSHAAISVILGEHGGKNYELVDIVIRGDEEDFRTYRLIHKPELKVLRQPGVVEESFRFLGSIVVMDGRYKLLSFKD